jgi:two-component system response regulator TctD
VIVEQSRPARLNIRFLLVEDSARLRELLSERVRGANWRLDAVDRVAAARDAAARVEYDLVLLDLGLPDGDAMGLIREWRRAGFAAPILVITARASIDDRIEALDSGADDYLVKPFNHFELLARCRALLRRSASRSSDEIAVGALVFDPASRSVRIGEEAISIAPRELSLLDLLIRNANRVVAKEQIETALSEFGDEISTNAVELAMSRLRRRLAGYDHGVAFETIRGVGYLMREIKHDG